MEPPKNMENHLDDNRQQKSQLEMQISDFLEKSNIDEKDKETLMGFFYQSEEYEGPLPPPAMLGEYESLYPGSAEKIFQMAEKEQEHRHKVESAIVDSQTSISLTQMDIIKTSTKLKIRLQLFGFFLTSLLTITGGVCIFLDKNVGGITTFVLAIGSFCWTMFYGKREPNDEIKAEDGKDKELKSGKE